MTTEEISGGDEAVSPCQAPQTLCPSASQEPVPASIRVISLLAFGIFVFFGAKTKHWVSEVGLAFVTGGALFATPQLVAALIASAGGKRTSAFKSRLREVTFIGVIVLGILVFKARPRGLDAWKLGVLFAAALLEVVIVLVVVPFWLAGGATTLFPPEESNWLTRLMGKLAPCLRKVTNPPVRWVATIEEDAGFLILGAGLFLIGAIMQFIAGA
jgi:hypothetical protein